MRTSSHLQFKSTLNKLRENPRRTLKRFPIWDHIREQETRGYPSLEFTRKPLKVVSTYVQWPSRATCLQWSWLGYHPIPQTSWVPSRGCRSRSYIYQHTAVLSQEQQLQEDSAHMMQASSTNQIKPNSKGNNKKNKTQKQMSVGQHNH